MTYQSKSSRFAKKHISRRSLWIGTVAVGLAYGGLLLGSAVLPQTSSNQKSATEQHVTILFDTSDHYSFGQNEWLNQYLLEDLPRTISTNDRLDLFAFTQEENTTVTRVFSGVSPKRATDVNRAIHSPKRQQQIWHKTFWVPFCNVLAETRQSPPLERSPLREALFEVARTMQSSKAKEKHLWIISDGLQHSGSDFSAYNGSIYEPDNPYQDRYPIDLSGVRVRILYLWRPQFSHLQTDQHQRWLTEWFTDAQASDVTIERG